MALHLHVCQSSATLYLYLQLFVSYCFVSLCLFNDAVSDVTAFSWIGIDLTVTMSFFITNYSTKFFQYIQFQDTKLLNVTLAPVPFKRTQDLHVGIIVIRNKTLRRMGIL